MFFKSAEITGGPVANPERILNLTERELDVLACLQSGKNIKKIAAILDLSPKTVKNHIYNMMQKTGKHSRVSLVELSERSGYAEFLRDRYIKFLRPYDFKNNLLQIARATVLQKQTCCIKCTEPDLFILLSEHLKVLNILVLSEARKENCVIITILTREEGPSNFTLNYDGNYYRLFANILRILLPKAPFLERVTSNYITDSCSNFLSYPSFPVVKEEAPLLSKGGEAGFSDVFSSNFLCVCGRRWRIVALLQGL